MRNLIRKIIKEELNEALSPSQFRKYVKNFNRNRYEQLFKELGSKYGHDKNFYRIYVPIIGSTDKPEYISQTNKEVKDFIEDNGYELVDYIKGVAKFKNAKNTKSIGKVLKSLGNELLLSKFVSDEERKAYKSTELDNLMVVISRHPYDITGSDTDRNWTNCMTMAHPKSEKTQSLVKQHQNLKDRLKQVDNPGLKKKVEDLKNKIEDRKEMGENVKYLMSDVKKGSLISYLINKNDKNINNPLSVLNIKPYVNKKDNNDFILISDNTMYGNGIPEFKKTVDKFLKDMNGGDRVDGIFCLKDGIYNDGGSREINYKKINWKNNKVYSGHLDLANWRGNHNVTDLGILTKVTGNLSLVNNPIKYLGNLEVVYGDLDLRGTQIESLGDLHHVKGNLDLSGTPIKDLGNLKSVGGSLHLARTPIESLGKLESVGGSLHLARTPIKDLGNLESVDFNLYLEETPISKMYSEEEIRQMVNIGRNLSHY